VQTRAIERADYLFENVDNFGAALFSLLPPIATKRVHAYGGSHRPQPARPSSAKLRAERWRRRSGYRMVQEVYLIGTEFTPIGSQYGGGGVRECRSSRLTDRFIKGVKSSEAQTDYFDDNPKVRGSACESAKGVGRPGVLFSLRRRTRSARASPWAHIRARRWPAPAASPLRPTGILMRAGIHATLL
jgi:hypothetical protein